MVFIYRSISPEYFVLPVPTLTSSTSKLSTVMNTSGYLHVNYRTKKHQDYISNVKNDAVFICYTMTWEKFKTFKFVHSSDTQYRFKLIRQKKCCWESAANKTLLLKLVKIQSLFEKIKQPKALALALGCKWFINRVWVCCQIMNNTF